MGALAEFYDDTPRVRFLEALVELAPVEFTVSQAAQMFGEDRQTFYRVVDDFVKEGLLVLVKEEPKTYRVNEDAPKFRLMVLNQGALELLDDLERDREPKYEPILAKFSDSADDVLTDAEGPLVAVGPSTKDQLSTEPQVSQWELPELPAA